MHRARERRVGEVLHGARRPGRRHRDHDHRGPGHERDDAPRPAGVPRPPRAPVRLLHARHGDGGGAAERAGRGDERGRHSRGPRGEPLPLHRVPQHRGGRSGGGGHDGEGGAVRATAEKTGYVGSPVKRREDASLLTGHGTYVDNMAPTGTVSMVVVRSPYAHARVKSVDLDAARKAAGVVAAFSAADLQDDWKAAMPCAWPVTEDMKNPPHYPLTDTARYQGDGVAVVIAESRAQAKDAAELVEVDYEPLD